MKFTDEKTFVSIFHVDGHNAMRFAVTLHVIDIFG